MRIQFMQVLVLLLVTSTAYADKFFGIFPYATSSEVKSVYPNAIYSDIKPSWLKDDQKFISIHGSGIDGTISVIYSNELNRAKKDIQQYLDREASGESLGFVENEWKNFHSMAIKKYELNPSLDPWIVEQIRWSPSKEVKLATFIKRYGKPDREEIDDIMYRYKIWEKKYNIKAKVDDNNMIDVVVYGAIHGDYFCAIEWRNGKECNPHDFKAVTPQKKSSKKK